MFQSHASYAACGLCEPGTNRLVEIVRELGAATQLYGAKITGGGSGGTVAILGDRTKVWHEALRIKKELLAHTGHSAEIFRWSSQGAMAFGTLRLAPRTASG